MLSPVDENPSNPLGGACRIVEAGVELSPLHRWLRYTSRVLRTGLAFLVFGLGSVLSAAVLVPLVRFGCRDDDERQIRAQGVIHRRFVFFCWLLESLGLAQIDIEGSDRLSEPGILVVANHPTLIDAIVLISAMPQADCIVKTKNFENPFMKGMLKASGYLPNLGGQALVDACRERLESGRSLLLFPEGTRSPRKGLGAFQRGAAHIAVATRRDLLPVLITCDPPTLMKGQAWYQVPARRFELRVRVGEPISVDEFCSSTESRPMVARALTLNLRETFEKGLASGTF